MYFHLSRKLKTLNHVSRNNPFFPLIECTSSQSVSTDTLFQAKRSHCLSSSSDLGAGSLYVFSSAIIQMVSRGFTSREFASRWPFAIKFPNPSDTMSACLPPFSLQGFPTLAGHMFSYRCARNFDIVKLKFYFTFLPCRLITHILTAFSITFLTHLKKDGHTLLALSSKVSYVRPLVHLYHSDFNQQFNNFFD